MNCIGQMIMIDDQALGEAVNDRNADVCRSVNRLKSLQDHKMLCSFGDGAL